jgi:hypothetical protein
MRAGPGFVGPTPSAIGTMSHIVGAGRDPSARSTQLPTPSATSAPPPLTNASVWAVLPRSAAPEGFRLTGALRDSIELPPTWATPSPPIALPHPRVDRPGAVQYGTSPPPPPSSDLPPMAQARLPRRRGGARRATSERATGSPPRHRTSRLRRLFATESYCAPGASPLSSVLAGTPPAACSRTSARPSASSERLPRTSAQPPTSWERSPDGLGAPNEAWRAAPKDEEALSTTPGGVGRSSELAPTTWEVRPMSGEACPRGRGGPFEAIGTTVRVLRATSHVVGRASQSLGALAHALGRTTQVVGNCRPCLRSMFRCGGLPLHP